MTSKIIVSSNFYLIDECNLENLFLVKGTTEKFSAEGDSGFLVFSRLGGVQQNHVDVLDMVYANNLILYDDVEFDNEI